MYVKREDLVEQRRYYLPLLKKSFFIHPTDLMYAIGCDATNNNLVLKLRVLKHWQTQPFNIIAPSKEWIRENVDVPEEALNQLPGPVTIIARLKNPSAVATEVHIGTHVVGIRMPKHWISSIVAHLGVPIVSTCANKRAQTLMTHIHNGHEELLNICSVVVDEGEKSGQQPMFIDYTQTTILTE
ncbi:MAG: Sua5/YciO/YrdC/YwlC family protein [Candidatus Woesearchaeota archaeon]